MAGIFLGVAKYNTELQKTCVYKDGNTQIAVASHCVATGDEARKGKPRNFFVLYRLFPTRNVCLAKSAHDRPRTTIRASSSIRLPDYRACTMLAAIFSRVVPRLDLRDAVRHFNRLVHSIQGGVAALSEFLFAVGFSEIDT